MVVAAVACMAWAFLPPVQASVQAPAARQMNDAAPAADYFSHPLPTWEPHCLGFGSEWRLCDGTVLRRCSPPGAIWLHTGVDITTGIQPVMAAANGVIVGYTIDPTFRGGVLIRHQTAQGIVLTQYWHVWPRAGFGIGTVVTRGEVFADIANMGSLTHFHFAVYMGDYNSATAFRGALPPASCDGFPAWPNRFVNPNDFFAAHAVPPPTPFHRCHGATVGP